MVRSWLSTVGMGLARYFGEALGCEVVVETDDHSIYLTMETRDTDRRAWDPDMFHSGQMYRRGYANPIKPVVRQNVDLDDPDTIDVQESAGDDENDSEASDGPYTQLISSPRYHAYMRQDLISQLLNPREQWQLIVYGLIGLGILIFVNIIIVIYATGGF